MVPDAVRSKMVVMLLLIHCLLLLPMFVCVLCLVLATLLCKAVLSVLSSFAIISLRERQLIALLCVLVVV